MVGDGRCALSPLQDHPQRLENPMKKFLTLSAALLVAAAGAAHGQSSGQPAQKPAAPAAQPAPAAAAATAPGGKPESLQDKASYAIGLNLGKSLKPTDTVTVNYKGTLLDGTTFDSSYDRKEPATFVLNQVIPGWTEGVQLMKVGSKYRFYIPPALGYGDRGAGNAIGPNAPLIFEVELLSIGQPNPPAGTPGAAGGAAEGAAAQPQAAQKPAPAAKKPAAAKPADKKPPV